MKKFILTIALGLLASFAAFAQDITGIWQGTLRVKAAQRDLRIVVKISKDQSALKAVMYSIDQGGGGFGGTVTLQAPTVKIAIAGIGATYEGTLDSEGTVLTGNWSQGGSAMPLELKHVNAEAAWPIPEPSAGVKHMAADAPLNFEVATIKPSKPGAPGKGITMRGPKEFVTINTSLNDLITFAYGIHVRQISGGPAWLESDLFDIVAKPEADGLPNRKQLEGMLQKLLADRFKLTFHREKKELSVYAITVAKTGSKLTKSEGDPNGLPGLGFRGLGNLVVRNANMSDFAGLMQSAVLDRPVVDRTGLTGRFDFTLNWTPDEFQFRSFGGPVPPPPTDKPDAPPDLYTAIQQQAGLKIEAAKAQVDVLVIDKVEKPSEN
jgi:bla regulator protein blaR1